MELTLSAVVAVSILLLTGAGHCAQFASGGDGVQSFPTSPLYVTLSQPMTTQHSEGKTFLILKKSRLWNAFNAGVVAIVLD